MIIGAIYLGGDVKPVDIKLSKDELFASVIGNVTKICKSFHNNIQLDYCGVITMAHWHVYETSLR